MKVAALKKKKKMKSWSSKTSVATTLSTLDVADVKPTVNDTTNVSTKVNQLTEDEKSAAKEEFKSYPGKPWVFFNLKTIGQKMQVKNLSQSMWVA